MHPPCTLAPGVTAPLHHPKAGPYFQRILSSTRGTHFSGIECLVNRCQSFKSQYEWTTLCAVASGVELSKLAVPFILQISMELPQRKSDIGPHNPGLWPWFSQPALLAEIHQQDLGSSTAKGSIQRLNLSIGSKYVFQLP